jgi:hypothetical protein
MSNVKWVSKEELEEMYPPKKFIPECLEVAVAKAYNDASRELLNAGARVYDDNPLSMNYKPRMLGD